MNQRELEDFLYDANRNFVQKCSRSQGSFKEDKSWNHVWAWSLELLGDVTLIWLTGLLIKILQTKYMFKEWRMSNLVLIYKKKV